MIANVYKKLINKLIDKTNSDEISWVKSHDDGLYTFRQTPVRIDIWSIWDSENQLYRIYFEYNDVKAHDKFNVTNEDGEEYRLMRNLLDVVSASAVKDSIASFLEQLDK